MAIYEYQCKDCGHKFSAMLSMTKREEQEKELRCPECESSEHKRLLSLFAMPSSIGAPGGSGAASCAKAKDCSSSSGGG